MNNKLTKEYVEGYNQATRCAHDAIERAMKKNGNNPLLAMNDIINNMYIQRNELELMYQIINEQENAHVNFTPESLIDEVMQGIASGNFTIILGGK